MDILDTNYLRLQFLYKVHKTSGTEFQSLFEEIMKKTFTDFQKIKPYGNEGDGGNDGYIPSRGEYYQVYAPENPLGRQADAAKKLKHDFNRLKEKWNRIAEVKKYYFVFNDKETGAIIKIESAFAELRRENKGIDFDKFSPENLERVFLNLSKGQILSLGFDVNIVKALQIASDYLLGLQIDLDRENNSILRMLENIRPIIDSLQNEGLRLEYDLIKCRALMKLERKIEAMAQFTELRLRYPRDIRILLNLAELNQQNDNFDESDKLLLEAETIDTNDWLLKLEKLVRDFRRGYRIESERIDEQTFPEEPRMRANFYRLGALALERLGDESKASSFIERAINLNPNRIDSYITKLSLLDARIFLRNKEGDIAHDVAQLWKEIETLESMVCSWGGMSIRNQATINCIKMRIYEFDPNYTDLGKIFEETFELVFKCHFDLWTANLITELLARIQLSSEGLRELIQYLESTGIRLPDSLAQSMVIQFLLHGQLLLEGREFFQAKSNNDIVEFIDSLASKNVEKAIAFLKKDVRFAVEFAATRTFPELNRGIIESLPTDPSIQKDKLLLLLNHAEGNVDETLRILKGLDLSNLRYFECKQIFQIIQGKKAWDFEVLLLEKLLKYEKDGKTIVNVKLQLFTAYLNLGKYLDAIHVGENILSSDQELSYLDEGNREKLLGFTLHARLKRGEYREAQILLERHTRLTRSFLFKVSIEVEVYLKNGDAKKALLSIVDGVRIRKEPSREEYASLFPVFTEIGNMIEFPGINPDKVGANCFVKLKDQDIWYFMGNDNNLDAIKLTSGDEKYRKMLDKPIGSQVVFEYPYRSKNIEATIECILHIDQYIHWQCMRKAGQLIEQGWDGMERIEVPPAGDSLDLKFIIARMEDEQKKFDDIFQFYCKQELPLSFLAAAHGGLVNAVEFLLSRNEGFIRFSTGSTLELEYQKQVAKRLIAGEAFYLDGSSAFFLSESNLVGQVYPMLSSLRVPQSVINMLLEIKEKFIFRPGHIGFMGYSDGRVAFTSVDQGRMAAAKIKFETGIQLLESKRQNIIAISSINKSDNFSEQKVPSELCDAFVLAKKAGLPVLTDDFLLLKLNALETHQNAPDYCSSFALISALCEQNKISFDYYLQYFAYLASYRFRFLPVMISDLEKAILGDGPIRVIKSENIRKFNFSMTLSTKYGVDPRSALAVIVGFLKKIVTDDSIMSEDAEKIFAEILWAFPGSHDKRSLGEMILNVCIQLINRQEIVVGLGAKDKIAKLRQYTNLFNPFLSPAS